MKKGTSSRNGRGLSKGGRMTLRAALAIFGLALAFGTAAAAQAPSVVLHTVGQDAGDEVVVCGIASEYCVRESVLDLLKSGRRVTVLANALGWVDREKHEENLRDLEARGVRIDCVPVGPNPQV